MGWVYKSHSWCMRLKGGVFHCQSQWRSQGWEWLAQAQLVPNQSLTSIAQSIYAYISLHNAAYSTVCTYNLLHCSHFELQLFTF